uniref:Uncharacterized protein n=1 Tax=Trichogramma kaykai TaxID=54128 RepID=A0ABD2WB98_9HYME
MNKGLVLENFRRVTKGEMHCANKNANIKIDNEGRLVAKTPDNRIIKLSRVISASEVADSLFSLRKFTELWYGVYLDKYKLEIFDKDTGECHLRGKYAQPNWIIDLDLFTSDKNEEQTCYVVTTNLLSFEAPASQAQSDITNLHGDYRIDLGRENTKAEPLESQSIIQAEAETKINRKIIDCNQTLTKAELNKLYRQNKVNTEYREEKPSQVCCDIKD